MLLASPGKAISVLDLYHAGTLDESQRTALMASGLAVGDHQAVAAYRTALQDLDDELEEAREWADESRLAALAEQRDLLLSQIKSMIGVGGKLRRANDPLRRPRDNVTKAIRRTMDNLRTAHMTDLAKHLDAALVFGGEITYQPTEPIIWETRPISG
jgi:hypothetical protein